MTREEAHKLLHAYIDGELDPVKSLELEAHLAENPPVRAACERLRGMSAVMRTFGYVVPYHGVAGDRAARSDGDVAVESGLSAHQHVIAQNRRPGKSVRKRSMANTVPTGRARAKLPSISAKVLPANDSRRSHSRQAFQASGWRSKSTNGMPAGTPIPITRRRPNPQRQRVKIPPSKHRTRSQKSEIRGQKSVSDL